uniref:Uncharacterized protein n=1 Tax=Rhizophora mucronata TaxID=61149 RepID=A0A2P2PYL3_RHIMU
MRNGILLCVKMHESILVVVKCNCAVLK